MKLVEERVGCWEARMVAWEAVCWVAMKAEKRVGCWAVRRVEWKAVCWVAMMAATAGWERMVAGLAASADREMMVAWPVALKVVLPVDTLATHLPQAQMEAWLEAWMVAWMVARTEMAEKWVGCWAVWKAVCWVAMMEATVDWETMVAALVATADWERMVAALVATADWETMVARMEMAASLVGSWAARRVGWKAA